MQRAGNNPTLHMRDQGMAIEPEHHQRICERLARAISSRHFGGAGPGRWLARQGVEASAITIALDLPIASETPDVG